MSSLLSLLLAGLAAWILARDKSQLRQRERLIDKLAHERSSLQEAIERQQELQDCLVEERKLASLGMMVAGVAHELNTPLATARLVNSQAQQRTNRISALFREGLTREALENYIKDNDEGQRTLEKAMKRCIGLVESFKRLASDRANTEISLFFIDQVVADVHASLTPRLKHSPAELRVDCPKGIEMRSDPGALSQVLQNLIDNALIHGLGDRERGEIHLSVVRDAEVVVIDVRDTGSGIPEDIRQDIFDPFVTTRRGAGSTGIGLHLVHELVIGRLSGQVELLSTGQEGTTFRLRLPIRVSRR